MAARWAMGIAAAAAGVLLSAAAAVAGQDMTPAFARGAEIAQTRCSSCHGVALESASPAKDAPLFRVLSRLYSAENLETKLLDIADHGHFEMPPLQLREDEIADVAAYIAGLDGGAFDVPKGRISSIAGERRIREFAPLRSFASTQPRASGVELRAPTPGSLVVMTR